MESDFDKRYHCKAIYQDAEDRIFDIAKAIENVINDEDRKGFAFMGITSNKEGNYIITKYVEKY